MATTKTCPQCGETLPLADFRRSKRSPDGHQDVCKACRGYRVRRTRGVRQHKVTRHDKVNAVRYWLEANNIHVCIPALDHTSAPPLLRCTTCGDVMPLMGIAWERHCDQHNIDLPPTWGNDIIYWLTRNEPNKARIIMEICAEQS